MQNSKRMKSLRSQRLGIGSDEQILSERTTTVPAKVFKPTSFLYDIITTN